MKKFLLLFIGACLITCTGWGQIMKRYDGINFTKMSANGEWLAQENQGSCVIFNTVDSVYYEYGSESGVYSLGIGNAFTDSGILAGSTSDTTPAYWQNGTWHNLPVNEVDTVPFNMANAITPDGAYIVGSMACGRWGADTEGQLIAPVVWSKGENGEYQTYEKLPMPSKDFTGRTPMYITAISITDDGKTIAGQFMDYTGFSTCAIIYERGANGKWTYKKLGEELLYKVGTEFPKWPDYEPKYPKILDYLSNEELAKYEEAKTAYEDSVELYNNQLIEFYPNYYPVYDDFLKDPDKKEAYDNALEKYKKENDAYSDSTATFYNVYYDAVTDQTFDFNCVYLSANGAYYATTLKMPDPDSAPDPEFGGGTIVTPVCYDLKNGELKYSGTKDMLTTSVLNDGTIIAGAPYQEYTRDSWVIPAGDAKAMLLADWIKAKSVPAYDWLKKNFTFSWEGIEYDENFEEVPVTVTDSLITGTVNIDPEGLRISGIIWDGWREDEHFMYYTYLIDLSKNGTGIKGTEMVATEIKIYPNPTADIIHITGNLSAVYITDLSGRRVYTSTSDLDTLPVGSILGNGVYLINVTTKDGKTKTEKLTIAK